MRVLIVIPPFGPIEYPVLGPSLLKPAVENVGATCALDYASIRFANRIGFGLYNATYYADPSLLLADRSFAPALFGDALPSTERFWKDVVEPYAQENSGAMASSLYEDRMLALRTVEREATAFVDEVAESAAVSESDIVGFSTTFGQNIAALAIAERIKAIHPEKRIVFGGANCEGMMGRQLLESFSCVDYVADGPADLSFPALVAALEAGETHAIPGIRVRGDEDEATVSDDAESAMDVVLDDLPYPDFSDFFRAYDDYPDARRFIAAIPVEGSRGCWWGAKHHCVFCGIDERRMPFTHKSARRLYDEINTLAEKWEVGAVWATDYILDPRYLRDLVPMLGEKRSYDEMFYEVKANLRREEMETLAQAGITRLQPGIESLSSEVLSLMRKGTTTLQNLQVLKWAQELGLTLQWNIICGFPEETPEQYEEMVRVMELVPHLAPPKGCSRITIDRFSPLFEAPEAFGIEIEPAPAYAYVYALPDQERARLAYFYMRSSDDENARKYLAPPSYASNVARQVAIWKRIHHRVRFEYTLERGGVVELFDTRPCAPKDRCTLGAFESEVFLCLDRARSAAEVAKRLGGERVGREDDIEGILERMKDTKLVFEEGGRYLALATRADDKPPLLPQPGEIH